jgi:integrase
MPIAKLTALKVERLTRPGLYNDGGGLYLRIAPGGSKGWIFRFKINGRTRDMGLGGADTFSLKQARERARKCRELQYEGVDPIEERRERRRVERLRSARTMTFRDCADAYIAAHQASWKNPKHAAQWPSTMARFIYPVFGTLSVQSIDTGLVLKVIEPLWTVKTETASRVRGRIEAVLDWAAARGYRQGDNPARWRGHLENLLPQKSKVARVEHHQALRYLQIGAFMAELGSQKGIAARALEFLILTASRTNEVLGATWDEIDLEERIWTVPAARMKKTGKQHRVPLSHAAFAIVRSLIGIQCGEFVFPGMTWGKPLSNMSLLMLLRRMEHDELTVHGFRSTFTDWAAERTAFPIEVRQMALAHTVGDKVEAAYRRGDLFEKRRQLGQAWAEFCGYRIGGAELDRIVASNKLLGDYSGR